MADTPQKRAVDEIQASLKSFLKAEGFRVRGRIFNRRTSDGITQVIGFQMGRFDPPGTNHIPGLKENMYGRFTVELGVYVPELYDPRFDAKPGEWVHHGDGHLRACLGELCDEGEDRWWIAAPDQSTTADLLLRLSSAGLPWLERYDTRDKIIAACDGKPPRIWGAEPNRRMVAVMLARRGEKRRAREFLQAEFLEETDDRSRAELTELAGELGLEPLDR